MSNQLSRLLLISGAGLGLALLTFLIFSAGSASVACEAPFIGDWIIDEDCILQEDQAAAENVIVRDGAQLTIPDDITLGVGFDNYSLRVESDSRIIVEDGGRIATFRCPDVDPELLNAPSRFRYGVTGNQLSGDFYSNSGLAGQGYRPQRLTGYRRGNETRFATQWLNIGGPVRPSDFDLMAAEFDDRQQFLAGLGFRPIDVSGYNLPSGAARFADIWVSNTDGLDWEVFRNDTLGQLRNRVPQGLVPVRVEAYQTGGVTRYISLWVESECRWHMELHLTREQYLERFNEYAGVYRLIHLDQYTAGGNNYYNAIWWQRPPSGSGALVRSNRDWYLFQRFLNNNWCNGFALTNFYAADHPDGVDGVRFGGIWNFDQPLNVPQTAPLSLKVQQEINCASGRGGGAIIRVNANTGVIEEEIYHHADQIYGPSSTIKSAIMLEVLRLIDANQSLGLNLNYPINVGNPYGGNGGSWLQPGQNFGIGFLMRTMIANSNNWAANRLIDCLANLVDQSGQLDPSCTNAEDGMAVFNDAMDDLGLPNTRLRRYMTGTGPQPTGSNAYMQNGVDNSTTPREYATLLRMIHENDDGNGNALLSPSSYNFFWSTMQLDPSDLVDLVSVSGDGNSMKGLINGTLPLAMGSNWNNFINIANKAGGNNWLTAPPQKPQLPINLLHFQRSDAGRLGLDNNSDGIPDDFVFFALFFDEATITGPTISGSVACIGAQVARAYLPGQSSGTPLNPPCRSP